jgi:hypothetical protein
MKRRSPAEGNFNPGNSAALFLDRHDPVFEDAAWPERTAVPI